MVFNLVFPYQEDFPFFIEKKRNQPACRQAGNSRGTTDLTEWR